MCVARVQKSEATLAAPVVAQMQTAPVTPPPAVQNSVPVASARTASAAARSGPVLYRDGDPDVVAPVPIKQVLPQRVVPQGTRPGAWQPEGVIELTIDESGDVVNVALRKPFHPSYDPQIVKAAMGWKYEPARKDGVPVRYVRMTFLPDDETGFHVFEAASAASWSAPTSWRARRTKQMA